MAGFLDFLQGDDAQLGLALLAAGGPTTDPNRSGFGQRMASAVGSARAQQQAAAEAALKGQFVRSQIDENSSQALLRRAQGDALKREAEAKAAWLAARGYGPAGAPMIGPGVGGAPGGAPGAPGAPMGAGPGGGSVETMTADDVLAAKVVGIGDITPLWQATRPDPVEIAPGVWADKRKMALGENPVAIAAKTRDRIEANSIAMRGEGQMMKGPDGGDVWVPKTALAGGAVSSPVAPQRAPLIGTVPGMTGRAGPTNAAERGMAADVAQVQIDPVREATQVREMLATPGAIKDPGDRQQAVAYLAKLDAQVSGGGAPAAPAATPGLPLIGPGRDVAGLPPGAIPSGMSQAQKDAAEIEKERRLAIMKEGVSEAVAPAKSAREVAAFTAKEEAKTRIGNASAADGLVAKADDALKSIDKALTHPGFNAGTGLSSVVDPRNYIPGTDAYDFKVRVEQLKGKAFMQAFQDLKGGGAISEKEGEKATAAIARLDRAQSDKEYAVALGDLREVIVRGKENALRMKAGGGTAAAPAGGGGGGNVDDLLKKYLK